MVVSKYVAHGGCILVVPARCNLLSFNIVAGGKHLTLAKAKLIGGEVDELVNMTNEETGFMSGLKLFANSQ